MNLLNSYKDFMKIYKNRNKNYNQANESLIYVDQMRQRIRNAKVEKHSRPFSFNFEHKKSFYSFLFARNHTAKNSGTRYHGKEG